MRSIDAGSTPRITGIADTCNCSWSAKIKAIKPQAGPSTPKLVIRLKRILGSPRRCRWYLQGGKRFKAGAIFKKLPKDADFAALPATGIGWLAAAPSTPQAPLDAAGAGRCYALRETIRSGRIAMAQVTLLVDGRARTLDIDDPDMPLLYALRDDLGFNNPRFGCGLGQCGACTVQIDGKAVRSCVTPVSSVAERKITTLAGIGTPEKPHPVQAAWIEEQVNQCGYCINGWILTAVELLERNPKPTDAQIKEAFNDLICRCGTHNAALKAVKRAAQQA
jgi:nicotinate dehydrogenase subunit A